MEITVFIMMVFKYFLKVLITNSTISIHLGYMNSSSMPTKKAALLSMEMRPFILKVNQPALGDFLLWQHDSPPLPEYAPSPCR